MRFLTADQICNEYKSYKIQFWPIDYQIRYMHKQI